MVKLYPYSIGIHNAQWPPMFTVLETQVHQSLSLNQARLSAVLSGAEGNMEFWQEEVSLALSSFGTPGQEALPRSSLTPRGERVLLALPGSDPNMGQSCWFPGKVF